MKCVVIFDNLQCFLQGHTLKGPHIPLGKAKDGLYLYDQTLPYSDSLHTQKNCLLSAQSNTKMWHLRLGHMSFSQFKYLPFVCNVNNCLKNSICQVCPAAEQTRFSFPTSSIKSKSPFYLLHIDV